MKSQIHLTAATVVNQEDRYLMVKETIDGTQVINQPAGHVIAGEDVFAAALRETLEETGWNVRLSGFLGFSTYFSPTNSTTYYRLTFCAEPVRFNSEHIIDTQIDQVLWMSKSQLIEQSQMLRSPMVMHSIIQYEKQQIFSLDLFCNHL